MSVPTYFDTFNMSIVSHNYCVISIIVCSLPVAKTATCITSPSDCLDRRFCLVFVPLPLSKYGRLFAMKAFGILVCINSVVCIFEDLAQILEP